MAWLNFKTQYDKTLPGPTYERKILPGVIKNAHAKCTSPKIFEIKGQKIFLAYSLLFFPFSPPKGSWMSLLVFFLKEMLLLSLSVLIGPRLSLNVTNTTLKKVVSIFWNTFWEMKSEHFHLLPGTSLSFHICTSNDSTRTYYILLLL